MSNKVCTYTLCYTVHPWIALLCDNLSKKMANEDNHCALVDQNTEVKVVFKLQFIGLLAQRRQCSPQDTVIPVFLYCGFALASLFVTVAIT